LVVRTGNILLYFVEFLAYNFFKEPRTISAAVPVARIEPAEKTNDGDSMKKPISKGVDNTLSVQTMNTKEKVKKMMNTATIQAKIKVPVFPL